MSNLPVLFSLHKSSRVVVLCRLLLHLSSNVDEKSTTEAKRRAKKVVFYYWCKAAGGLDGKIQATVYLWKRRGSSKSFSVPFWLVYQLLPWGLSINRDSSMLFHKGVLRPMIQLDTRHPVASLRLLGIFHSNSRVKQEIPKPWWF